MLPAIPKTMKAVFLNAYKEPLVVKEVPVPIPSSGQVLVKMEASPINPSDLAFLTGSSIFQINFYFIFPKNNIKNNKSIQITL